GEQRIVEGGCDEGCRVEDEDAISVHYGMQAVGDHDGRAALAKVLDGALNLALGFGIERGGRLVEQDEWSILEQRARDCDALALAAGELQSVLPDGRVIAARKGHDEVVRVSGLGGGDDLIFARARAPERDVLPHRPPKQENV